MLAAAAWLGLLCGLVEGTGLVLFHRLGWLNWNIAKVPVTAEIVWVSALADLLLFAAAGLPGIAATRVLSPQRFPARFTVSALVFLLFFDWLALSGRIQLSGALVLALGLAAVFTRWFAKREEAVFRFWRRTLPVLAGVALFAFLAIEGGARFAERRALAQLPDAPADAPNVLVVVVDTLRADHLSTYGYPRATSPQIDRVATEGVLFEKAISTTSWTLPAHVSLLTGRYPYENQSGSTPLDPRHSTLAEFLRARGYRTGAFSANLFYFTRSHGFGRGFIRFEDFFGSWADSFTRTLYGRKFVDIILPRLGYGDIVGRKRAEYVTDRTLDWIGSDSRPFFAFLNYFDAHDPYLPPQPYRSKFSRQASPGGKLIADKIRNIAQLTPYELQGEIDAYDGAIAYVDQNIGRLLDALEEKRLAQRTVVVVVSDHGEMFGEHELLLHQNCLYRPVVHVPLIVRWRGQIPAGLRVAQPVSIASLPATLAELTGSGEKAFPSPSLAELWREPGPRDDWPYPFAELDALPFEPMKHEPVYHGAMKSLVSPEWQFITHEKFGEELYDWENDPAEKKNLVNIPEGQEAARELASTLHGMLARPQKAGPKAAGASPTRKRNSVDPPGNRGS